uniref:C2H2-type domain-containing protein n=1 Tax=Strongyloides papillosus TaxID=174720 RepID=A0A0N5BBI9_STREA
MNNYFKIAGTIFQILIKRTFSSYSTMSYCIECRTFIPQDLYCDHLLRESRISGKNKITCCYDQKAKCYMKEYSISYWRKHCEGHIALSSEVSPPSTFNIMDMEIDEQVVFDEEYINYAENEVKIDYVKYIFADFSAKIFSKVKSHEIVDLVVSELQNLITKIEPFQYDLKTFKEKLESTISTRKKREASIPFKVKCFKNAIYFVEPLDIFKYFWSRDNFTKHITTKGSEEDCIVNEFDYERGKLMVEQIKKDYQNDCLFFATYIDECNVYGRTKLYTIAFKILLLDNLISSREIAFFIVGYCNSNTDYSIVKEFLEEKTDIIEKQKFLHIGDNLELAKYWNSSGNFGSFGAESCRFCLTKNMNLELVVKESTINRENRVIRTDDYFLDSCHDFYLGSNLYFIHMWTLWLKNTDFSLESFNRVLSILPYGEFEKITPFTSFESVTITSAVSKSVIIFFPFIMKFLTLEYQYQVDDFDDYLYLYRKICKIERIINSQKLYQKDLDNLSTIVEEYLTKLKFLRQRTGAVTGRQLYIKPKEHNLIHMVNSIKKNSNLYRHSSIRYESLHKNGKRSIINSNNKKNASFTAASKNLFLLYSNAFSFDNDNFTTDESLFKILTFKKPNVTRIRRNLENNNDVPLLFKIIEKDGVNVKGEVYKFVCQMGVLDAFVLDNEYTYNVDEILIYDCFSIVLDSSYVLTILRNVNHGKEDEENKKRLKKIYKYF